jgi:hypothetical protein
MATKLEWARRFVLGTSDCWRHSSSGLTHAGCSRNSRLNAIRRALAVEPLLSKSSTFLQV